jgi:hypothetical protein
MLFSRRQPIHAWSILLRSSGENIWPQAGAGDGPLRLGGTHAV